MALPASSNLSLLVCLENEGECVIIVSTYATQVLHHRQVGVQEAHVISTRSVCQRGGG